MKKPSISVVMPVYNGSAFIRSQLESILAQSMQDFELVVSDDGSTDDTIAILQDYAARDGRIRLLLSDTNRGMLSNLDRVIRHARADWLAISDQDDVWHVDKLSSLLRQANACDAVYCNSELIDEQGALLGSNMMQVLGVTQPASGRNPFLLMWQNCVSGHALLFRRRLWQACYPFSACLPYDQQLAIEALAGDGLVYVPDMLVQHRLHAGNYCNHSLVKPAATVERVVHRGKLDRRRHRREILVGRLEYFRQRKIARDSWASRLAPECFDHQWFDGRIFLAAMLHPEIFISGKKRSRFRQALKFAKGARWYRFENRLRGLLAISGRMC